MPRDVLLCQKDATVAFYNTPLAVRLGDKRNLALLSEHADSQRLSVAQRAAIREHIPWARLLRSGPQEFEGREVEMRELLAGDRGRFVLKKGLAASGKGVVVGKYSPLERWNEEVVDALRAGDWLVQEYLPSRPYFFPSPDFELTRHEGVYGVFSFGDRYAGAFLRRLEPGKGDGVINFSRGAVESLFLELSAEASDAREGEVNTGEKADLEAAVAATHADLSALSGRFLEEVRARPEMCRRADYRNADLPPWLKHFTYELQAWPIFVGETKLAEVRDATVAVTGLLRTVYDKIFDGDAVRISEFFGLDDELGTELMLEPPTGLAGSLARCDFIDTGSGFQCLEVNMSANIGGWQLAFWEKVCCSQPTIATFLEREGVELFYRDLLETLFEQILDDCRKHEISDDGRLSIVLVTEPHKVQAAAPAAAVLKQRFRAWLAEAAPELDGEFHIAAFSPELKLRGGDLALSSGRVHCLLCASEEDMPREVLSTFKRQRLMLYNTPPAAALSDKRFLALLSENADSPRFSAAERAAIERYIPWTRIVGEREVSFEGRAALVDELLVDERERFVLKAGAGAGGEQVHAGWATPAERWRELVREAAAAGDWVAQEYLTSRPYLFQSGEQGHAPHEVVWGLFCFGKRYGGGFLRIMPHGEGDGVLNAARGATEAFIYEV